MRSTSPSGIAGSPSAPDAVGVDRRDDVADEGAVLRPLGAKPGASSQHHTTTSAARSISVDLVAVDHALVAGEVDHPAAVRRAAPGRSRTARRCRARRRPAARSRRPASRSACPVGPIRTTGSPGFEQRAQIGRAAHLEHDRREQALRRGRPRRRSAPALPWPASCRRRVCAQRLVVLQPIELAGLEGARRHRRLAPPPRRSSASAGRPRARVARSSSSSRAISSSARHAGRRLPRQHRG